VFGGKNKKFLKSSTSSKDLYLPLVLARPFINKSTLLSVTRDGLKNKSARFNYSIIFPELSIFLKGEFINGWPRRKAAAENYVNMPGLEVGSYLYGPTILS
jgi:hypothetical protein